MLLDSPMKMGHEAIFESQTIESSELLLGVVRMEVPDLDDFAICFTHYVNFITMTRLNHVIHFLQGLDGFPSTMKQ